MKRRVAINGFGRIGRLSLRRALKSSSFDVVAINDLGSPDNLAYLFKYDSTHGTFSDTVQATDNVITIGGKSIVTFCEKEPQKLPWKELNIDYVLESSGHFTSYDEAKHHLEAGAKRVLISAPAKGDKVPTFVVGVNADKYDPAKHTVVSNASCTTNCLAPLVKVLLRRFGIEEALMTTVHAMTATQPLVDGPSKRDWRGGRGAAQNIIPASTGAARAVVLCIPELDGKLTGMAFRVPVADVSVVDLTVRLSQKTSYRTICEAMREASINEMKGIIAYCEEELVSSDFIGSYYSTIFDAKAGIELNESFFKLIAWYDNEMSYASRVVDLLDIMARREG